MLTSQLSQLSSIVTLLGDNGGRVENVNDNGISGIDGSGGRGVSFADGGGCGYIHDDSCINYRDYGDDGAIVDSDSDVSDC